VAGGDSVRAADAWGLGSRDGANFLAADLSFETTILLGILVGPLSAMAGGAILAIPAVLHHEYWSLPVNLVVAAIAGAFGRFADPKMSGRSRR